MITRTFLLAGNATFTLEVPENLRTSPEGKERPPHYTYRIQRVEATDRWPEAFFVHVLTGPSNTEDYTYLGKLNTFTGQVERTAKSAFPDTSFRYRLLNRVLARVWCDDHAAYEKVGVKAHHEGRCGRCGRCLTVPSSILSGIGPECAKILSRAS